MSSITTLERRFAASVVGRLMERDLRRSFRRVCWVDDALDIPENRALVVYANHHNFYDGYLGWYLIRELFRRRTITWMEEWDAYPLFASIGAAPFPSDDPSRRAATVRRTVRALRSDPGCALLYFPEGILHRPEAGVLAFPQDGIERLGRLLGDTVTWIPLGLHFTWRGESRPTVIAGAGIPHSTVDGWEHVRLEQVLARLRQIESEEVRIVMQGRRSPQEDWNLSALRGFFSRYL